MLYLPKASSLIERSLFLAAKGSTAAARSNHLMLSLEPLKRAFTNSVSSLQPHVTPSFCQKPHQEKVCLPPNPELETARPFDEIPRTKTFLGLNTQLMKEPTQMARYLTEQGDKLGSIFCLVGIPGLPDSLCLLDPKDVETVFRAEDSTYPRRLPIPDWVKARKELNMPIGLFLA